jgi:hypothetical protein
MHSVLGWRTLALSVVCLVAITAPAQTFTTLDTGVSAYGRLFKELTAIFTARTSPEGHRGTVRFFGLRLRELSLPFILSSLTLAGNFRQDWSWH